MCCFNGLSVHFFGHAAMCPVFGGGYECCVWFHNFSLLPDGHLSIAFAQAVRTMRAFAEAVMAHSFCILDGGMGRELLRRGAPFAQPQWSALALMQAPEVVKAVHADFIAAGAQVITTNSYALVPFHIGEAVFAGRAQELAALAGRLAREAADECGKAVRVAASLPPLFGSYRPDLFDADRAAEIAAPLIAGQAPFADLWLLETQSSLAEVQTLRALLPRDGKDVWVSFTLEDDKVCDVPRLRSGEAVAEAVAALPALDVQALLFNCSHPEVMGEALRVARAALDAAGCAARLGVYANAFVAHGEDEAALPANDGLDAVREDLSPEAYADFARLWRTLGADTVGGCCGIAPAHIAALAQSFLV